MYIRHYLFKDISRSFCFVSGQFTSFSLLSAPNGECGETLTQSSGWITSPDLDGDGFYDFNLRCSWIIKVDEHKAISFWLLYIELRPAPNCVADILYVSRNSYTSVCPPVRGDNPRALVQADKLWYNYFIYPHQCKPCSV